MQNNRLEQLREYMREMALSAFIIPSNDTHFGEYIQDYFMCRGWISGFDGSAGTVVVTLKEAALWTDSRYFIQAENQISGTGIVLKKLKMPGTESVETWLSAKLENNQSVGIDSSLFSVMEYNLLKQSLPSLNIKLCNDPFEIVWKERPKLRFNKISYLGEEITGESIASKHKRVVQALGIQEDFIYLVSLCDDIAWLCNIRGNDMLYNPVPLSYAALTKDNIHLFVSGSAMTAQDIKALEKEGVILHDYNSFNSFISDYPCDVVRIASQDKISVRNYNSAVKSGTRFIPDLTRGGVIAGLKALKNDVEAEGFRRAMINDGVAWVKLLVYIEKELKKENIHLTEKAVADKFAKFRAECPDYRGESFAPIVAFGKNAALPHYSISEEPVYITKSGFLLMDTGGQYEYGTTDSTRTIPLGPLTQEQKTDYTQVLKGMIALSMAKFPKGTRGSQLDILARGPVCSVAKLYLHGTGHGIGHRLCVHEGPQSIRMEENPVTIEPGMVISNEPAIYEEGDYGIRIENTILCKEWVENKYGKFYQFETLSFIPIDTTAVESGMFGREYKEWLNNYNSLVYEKLSPCLSIEEKKWLADKTAGLN
jgi:Xaa-Pro aminopeptidase